MSLRRSVSEAADATVIMSSLLMAMQASFGSYANNTQSNVGRRSKGRDRSDRRVLMFNVKDSKKGHFWTTSKSK